MIDYYYAFPDRMTMCSALEPLGMIYAMDDGPQIIQATHQYAAWEVGLIPPNETAWHLNVRLVDDTFDLSSLQPYELVPKNPVCRWA